MNILNKYKPSKLERETARRLLVGITVLVSIMTIIVFFTNIIPFIFAIFGILSILYLIYKAFAPLKE